MSEKRLSEDELEKVFLAIDDRFKSMAEHANKVALQLNEKFEAIGQAMAQASKAFVTLMTALRDVEERVGQIERERELEDYERGERQ